jgi:hypothetical protein
MILNLRLRLHLSGHSLVATTVTMLRSRSRTSDALVTHVPVHSEVLEGSALGLWNEKGGEDTGEHEDGENLHDVVEPRAGVVGCGVAANAQGRDGTLSNDRANLSRCG